MPRVEALPNEYQAAYRAFAAAWRNLPWDLRAELQADYGDQALDAFIMSSLSCRRKPRQVSMAVSETFWEARHGSSKTS